jgi:hypothetical protein
MRLRLVLPTIVLLMLAANPCFAKDNHAQHGARASATSNSASGKGATGANSTPSKANIPIDAEAIVAPPVLPPHGVAQQQIRIISPRVKTVGPGNASHGQAGAMTVATPIVRNAIGQPVTPPKNFAAAQPPALALTRSSAVSPPLVHGGTTVPPVSSAARVNLANAGNRDSINGATVIRPATGPSVIGGPARTRYGLNGTTVQNKR